MSTPSRLVAPTGGRFWWAGIAAAFTASTLSAASLLHGDPTLLIDLGGLRPPQLEHAAVAKWISVAASAIAMLMIGALGRPSSTSRRHVLIGLAIVLAFAAPTSVFWLQDGTLTGPLVATAIACGFALDRWLGATPTSDRVLVLGVAAALPATLSLDAAPIGIATLLAARAMDRTSWWPAFATALAVAVPIIAATYLDTNVAEVHADMSWRGVELVRAAAWMNPWWLVAPAVLVLVATRRNPLAPLGIFALVPVLVAVLSATGIRELLPVLAFAAAAALVYERHSGALARRLDHPATRRAWTLALAVGVLHVAITWPAMRTRFTPPAGYFHTSSR
jgi:hypothetical protein